MAGSYRLKGWTDFDQGVADKLVQLREECGLTQADMGAMIGRHQTHISEVEGGRRRLRFEEAVLLAEGLDLDVTDLLP